MTTALTIPTTVQPKPTKAEIIDALVALKIENIEAERRAHAEKRAELGIEIGNMLHAHAMSAKTGLPFFVKFGQRKWKTIDGEYQAVDEPEGVQVCLRVDDVPPEISARLMELYDIPTTGRDIDEKAIRKQVIAHLAGSSREDRVAALLDSPECRAALTAMLETGKS